MQKVGADLNSTMQQVLANRSGCNRSRMSVRVARPCSCIMSAPSLAYNRALNDIKAYDFAQIDVPLFSRQDDAIGCIDDLPLKAMEGRYLAQIVFDVIVEVPLDSVNYQQLEECMRQGQYTQLPPAFCPRIVPGVPCKMSVAIMKTTGVTQCTALKYFVLDFKTNLRTVEDMAYGALKLVDFTPDFHSGHLCCRVGWVTVPS